MKAIIILLAVLCAVAAVTGVTETSTGAKPTDVSTEKWYIAMTPDQNSERILHNHLMDISNPLSMNYGQYLTTDQIDNIVEPPLMNFVNVGMWLDEIGVLEYCTPESDVIVCENIPSYLSPFSNAKHHLDAELPDHLDDVIDFIDLAHLHHGIPRQRVHRNVKTSETMDQGYVSKEAIQRLYNYTDFSGPTHSVGVVEFQSDNGFAQENVEAIERLNNVSVQNISHVVGPNNQPPDGESALDVAMISQLGGSNSDMWFWDVNGWLYPFSVEFYRATSYPDVFSMSWGWNEAQQCGMGLGNCIYSEAYVHRVNYEFLKITARGTTITASSGDSGSCGRSNGGCETGGGNLPLNPVFPTSSNYVLSVGGTFVVADNSTRDYTTPICKQYKCATGAHEAPSAYDYTGWTQGSGLSNYFSQDYWQTQLVKSYLNSGVTLPNSSYYNATGRAYPDVVAVSNQCPVVSGGNQVGPSAGTSCSSPIWAALIGRLNSHQKSKGRPTLGFANPLLYHLKDAHPECWNTVLAGNTRSTEGGDCGVNNGYESTGSDEFNLVSGLGSPRIDCMINALDSIFS